MAFKLFDSNKNCACTQVRRFAIAVVRAVFIWSNRAKRGEIADAPVAGKWLKHNIKKCDRLMIGFVQCRSCSQEWEALALESTLTYLECPDCGAANSRVAGVVSENRMKSTDSVRTP